MIGNSQERYGPIPTTERIETNDDNCPSIRSRQSYYTIREENATTVQIIVQTSNFRQTLEVVECEREKIEQRPSDRQCFENLGLHSFSMRATCEETTATRSLLVYDPLKDQVMEKNYTISVCCSCRVTHK
ncbi:uncharacterized protein LOC113500616 [Trichoplusia ni]|uniref:Uncharacterized protein LOC113500616 n=1 Tax=Trichoplusia ni TaxID=7111 RepID=A0A7E5W9E7_TRINI|nr:uncharacterized protein LOC113500616 [Trichoplusia ni]XP_026737270.1 uncharacterized protein LOC113500616 [Trichoplusia ni]